MMVARIKCNKTPYMLPRGEHSGENLRAFFGVPDSHDLWVDCDGDSIRVDATDTKLFVDDGDKFYTSARKINQ